MNPTSGHGVLGTESRGPAWRVPAGLGAAPCPQGLQKSLTAAFNDDRTDLTLPRGCWALGVWPSPTMLFFANQFPMDVALLHMLQLALCSPEALTKAELSLCTGKWVTSTRTSAAMGEW